VIATTARTAGLSFDAPALERPAGFSEMFFVKLDYVLVAQSKRDRVGGDAVTLGRQLAEAVDGLFRS
jgi:hypothetical protein